MYASFEVVGTFDPAELTAVTGLAPTRTHRAATPIGNTATLTKADLWVVKTAGEQAWELEPHLARLLEQVIPRGDAIRAFLAAHDARAVVHAVVQGGDSGPVVVLTPEHLRAIADLGASFELDETR